MTLVAVQAMLVVVNPGVIVGRVWLTVECTQNATRQGFANWFTLKIKKSGL